MMKNAALISFLRNKIAEEWESDDIQEQADEFDTLLIIGAAHNFHMQKIVVIGQVNGSEQGAVSALLIAMNQDDGIRDIIMQAGAQYMLQNIAPDSDAAKFAEKLEENTDSSPKSHAIFDESIGKIYKDLEDSDKAKLN
jgi:hypothetical protein